jgi:hypothetical protein
MTNNGFVVRHVSEFKRKVDWLVTSSKLVVNTAVFVMTVN